MFVTGTHMLHLINAKSCTVSMSAAPGTVLPGSQVTHVTVAVCLSTIALLPYCPNELFPMFSLPCLWTLRSSALDAACGWSSLAVMLQSGAPLHLDEPHRMWDALMKGAAQVSPHLPLHRAAAAFLQGTCGCVGVGVCLDLLA